MNSRCKACVRPLPKARRNEPATAARAVLAPGEVIGICEAYYQRLVEGNQFPIAREAFRLVLEQPHVPAVKDFLAGRLKRIELVGKPAPPIQGTDLDGKAFNLANEKGKAVLVVFWASWCLPNDTQITWLEAGPGCLSRPRPASRWYQPRYPAGRRPETGNRLAQYPPVLARLQCPLAHAGQRLRAARLRRAYGVSDIPANVSSAAKGQSSKSTCRAGTSNPSSPECSVTKHIMERILSMRGRSGRHFGRIGGLLPATRRATAGKDGRCRQTAAVEMVRNPRKPVDRSPAISAGHWSPS